MCNEYMCILGMITYTYTYVQVYIIQLYKCLLYKCEFYYDINKFRQSYNSKCTTNKFNYIFIKYKILCDISKSNIS